MARHKRPDAVNPTAKNANRFWGSTALPKTKAEFFNAVTTPAPSGNAAIATIRMYGPIDSWGGYWGVSAKDVGDVLDALPDSVEQIILRINSPGGEVFEGVSILNMFRAHKASVTAVVDGLAASAASFIAAGADETVMSPGTQMMIHSPWTFTYGSAADLRKDAEVLDGIEASIVELYTAKAGDQDWTALLADDTWLTAQQAVDMKLADRIAVIPDAGETETVGSEDKVLVLPDGDEPEDSAARVVRILARVPRAQSSPTPPHSTERGSSIRKEIAVTNSNLAAGLRDRLGVSDADASDEQLLAAVDERLARPATFTPPDGTSLVDSAQLDELRAMAEDGRRALAAQATARREQIADEAVRTGRIAASARDKWVAHLEKDEAGGVELLATLQANTIPREEMGHSDAVTAEDALMAEAGWTDTKTEEA